MDIQPLLDDAKYQLKEEADYLKEAEFLQAFGKLLAKDKRFLIPKVLPELTHRNVLAMTYVSGSPIETIIDLPQAERDRVMTALIELMLLELFELKMVQTDPNFANYLYNRDTEQLVLLDFGACRDYPVKISNAYRNLFVATIEDDQQAMANALTDIGFFLFFYPLSDVSSSRLLDNL